MTDWYFDADHHYYETRDAFTRHIERDLMPLAVSPRVDADGVERVYVGDRPFRFTDNKYDVTNPPGSLRTLVKAQGHTGYSADHMHPAYQQRDARIALLDEQRIETAILLPTLAVTVESLMYDNVVQTYANLRAFNRWLDDDWGFARADGRIITPALLSLLDINEAVRELDRVLALGVKLVHLQTGPAHGRSPADPHFDPFWARLNEARVPVVYHIGDPGYHELQAPQWGLEPWPYVREMSAFQWAFLHGDRPIMETLGALIYGNLFGRFPDLQVLSIENGGGWVDYLLTLLDKKKGMGRRGPWVGGYFSGKPSEVFKRHIYVSPYPEDDIDQIIDRIGAERVLFGSDFPHPEGLAEPREWINLLAKRSQHEQQRIMRDNAVELFSTVAAFVVAGNHERAHSRQKRER